MIVEQALVLKVPAKIENDNIWEKKKKKGMCGRM